MVIVTIAIVVVTIATSMLTVAVSRRTDRREVIPGIVRRESETGHGFIIPNRD